MRRVNARARAAVLVVAVLVAPFFGAVHARAESDNLFHVLTGFSAKEACSCAFVVEQTDEYCQAFGQVSGFEVEVSIDRGARTVKSTFVDASRVARFTEGAGCIVDPIR